MNIMKIHQDIFNFLQSWSESSRTTDVINPYFYMRVQRDERFKKGYWFPGNDEYLCVSFWAGGDSNNKTPSVYFEVHKKIGVRVLVVSKDSTEKHAYFSKMVTFLNQNTASDRYEPILKGKIWEKLYSKNYQNFQKYLSDFIKTDKILIDNYLQEQGGKIEFEDFVSPFEFISASNFDRMLSRVLNEQQTQKETTQTHEESPINENTLKEPLPFYLQGISIENFQGIVNTSIADLPARARWIYITGENGYGKTTILQAIALGFDREDLEKFIETKSKIKITVGNNGVIIRSKNSTTAQDKDNLEKVVGYGPSRLNIQAQSSENAERDSLQNTMSLFDNMMLLKNINYELFAASTVNSGAFKDLENIIKTLTKGRIESIRIEGTEAQFVEKLSNGERLAPLPLSKLASGFRNIINMACDIYLRLRAANLQKSYNDFEGIVLIDEIETHLHPILQKELSDSFSLVFPKIQFIASTHSPIPLLGAPSDAVILKVNRNNEQGITIERIDEIVEFESLLPNTILTSPIFGFQDILPKGKDPSKFVRVEATYDEVIQNDQQKVEIQQFLSDKNHAALLKLLK